MPLRTRLAAALLAVVIGPVLIGAVLAGRVAAEAGRANAEDRLERAAEATHGAVAMLCDRLRAAAGAVALHPPSHRATAATGLIERGLADAVRVLDPSGTLRRPVSGAPPMPWADCDAPSSGAANGWRFHAVAAQAPLRSDDGTVEGQVWVAITLDAQLVRQWAGLARADVTVLGTGGTPLHSTDGMADSTAVAARALPPGAIGSSSADRWVRRLTPVVDQPLPLVISTPREDPQGVYAVIAAVVLLAGLLAGGAAWWVMRPSLRSMRQLADAANQIADGNAVAEIPTPVGEETRRLAEALKRVALRTRSYAHALTATREQLRGHLAILGEALASTHDLDGLVRVILRSLLTAGTARSGAVVLIDPTSGDLVGHRADWGEGGRVVPVPVRVPVGEGLIGAVAATGRVHCGRLDPDASWLHPAEPVCRTYLAVPVASPTDAAAVPGPPVRGVLALYDRVGAEEFDDRDVAALRGFAGQVAVAVDNVRSHEEAERLSLTDPLTGLWNYRSLRESLRREVERASRFRRTLAVLALDLDRFKEVNDAYGHPAGDAVLVELTQRIRAEIRNMDFVFRQGGEEFVVLLPEAGVEGGTVVAQRLGAAVRSRPVMIDSRGKEGVIKVDITVSIGIAVFPDHARTPQGVLDAADDALYAAKAAGRDTYRVATSRPAPVVALELPVRPGARTPEHELPQAGNDMGLSGGAQPPRQNRGR